MQSLIFSREQNHPHNNAYKAADTEKAWTRQIIGRSIYSAQPYYWLKIEKHLILIFFFVGQLKDKIVFVR